MEISKAVSEDQVEESATRPVDSKSSQASQDRVFYSLYAAAVATSISIWFIAIRAPLWLDETSSFWQISAGFWRIMSRRGKLSATYPYVLWLVTRVTGTSEIGIRVPSILAMLAAVCLLYLAASELFDRDVALITAILFCLHPLVIFTSIDARPYAFTMLAINSAVYILVRLRRSDSDWLAAAFGVAAAAIVHFQMLFGVILPVLAVCFLLAKSGKTLWRQTGIALVAFALVFALEIPDVLFIFHGRQMFVFDKTTPRLAEVGWILAPGLWVYILMGTVLVAAATRRVDLRSRVDGWRLLLCASLGLVPIMILYGVSAETPTNIWVERYRLVAVSGIALSWGWIVSRIDSRLIRVLFCLAVVSTTAYWYFRSPYSGRHGYSWKYALELAERNASADNAPVLICSDFPSSDYLPMPTGKEVKDSALFTPLSYYKLSVPVVGLPRALNDEAVRVGSAFVQEEKRRRERFLALGFGPSYETLKWLARITSDAYVVRELGQPNGILVLEFSPRE